MIFVLIVYCSPVKLRLSFPAIELPVLHPGGLEHLLDRVEERIVAPIDDFPEPGVDDQFRARQARGYSDVDCATGDGVAVVGGLADCVLLGMGAKAFLEMRAAFNLAGAARTTAGKAVGNAARRAIVAGDSMWLSFMMTAPTLRRMQLLRLETTRAISMK